MMEMLDFEVGIAAVDLLPEGETVTHVEISQCGEAGFQRGEAFGGGFGARKLFMVERDAAVGVEHRHQRLVETAFLDRAVGALLADQRRSEEHTSELQSLMRISYAVFCLKTKTTNPAIKFRR